MKKHWLYLKSITQGKRRISKRPQNKLIFMMRGTKDPTPITLLNGFVTFLGKGRVVVRLYKCWFYLDFGRKFAYISADCTPVQATWIWGNLSRLP